MRLGFCKQYHLLLVSCSFLVQNMNFGLQLGTNACLQNLGTGIFTDIEIMCR